MIYSWRYFVNKRQQRALNELKWCLLFTITAGVMAMILRGY